MATAVNERSADVTRLALEWPQLEALMGGTPAMRTAGAKFMPKFPGEELDAHTARVKTATLFPAFRRTVAVMSGKPFAKLLTHSEDTPPQIVEWSADIDREGVNLHTFAAEMMAEALAYGICGILVEAPKPIETANPVVTRQDEINSGIRPYFVRVRHDQILGWRLSRQNGKAVLTQLRIKETASVADGAYGEAVVDRVRVLTPGGWELFERRKTGTQAVWVSIENGISGLPGIPFVPLYGSRLAYMMGVSPLLDLAYMNTKHWQSQSDQDTILHVARVPILFAKGFEDSDDIKIGSSTAVKTTSSVADLAWVEHTGQAIGAGKESLDALEQQMIQAGAELLVKKPGTRTATETANDAEANKSDLQRITEGFEDGLDQALQFMADYAKLPTGGNVSLFKDFGASSLTQASGQLVLSMRDGGLISDATAIDEMKRRGELSDDIDPEAEKEAVDAQGPALGTMSDPTLDPLTGLPMDPQAKAA